MGSHNLEPKEWDSYFSWSVHFILVPRGGKVMDRACNCAFDRPHLYDRSLPDSDTQADDAASDFLNSG